MRKLYTLLFLIGITSNFAFSQDTIVMKNGDMYICHIQGKDSTRVYFSVNRGTDTYNNSTKRSKISAIKYSKVNVPINNDTTLTTNNNPGTNTNIISTGNINSPDIIAVGLGIGLDYGCFGGNISIYPQRNIGIFGSIGYAMVNIAYNAGVKIRTVSSASKNILQPFLIGMYGYNTGVIVTNAMSYSKLFYNFTAGFGLDYKVSGSSRCYYSMAVLIPFRGTTVYHYINKLETENNVKFQNNLMPITLSIGIKLILD